MLISQETTNLPSPTQYADRSIRLCTDIKTGDVGHRTLSSSAGRGSARRLADVRPDDDGKGILITVNE